jgi:hypothetical protein
VEELLHEKDTKDMILLFRETFNVILLPVAISLHIFAILLQKQLRKREGKMSQCEGERRGAIRKESTVSWSKWCAR